VVQFERPKCTKNAKKGVINVVQKSTLMFKNGQKWAKNGLKMAILSFLYHIYRFCTTFIGVFWCSWCSLLSTLIVKSVFFIKSFMKKSAPTAPTFLWYKNRPLEFNTSLKAFY